jgi:malonate decarboxylase alpha subunit
MVRRAVFNGTGGDHPAAPGDAQSSVVRLTSRAGVGFDERRALVAADAHLKKLRGRMTDWRKGQGARDAPVRAGAKFAKGKIVEARDATALLESVIRPGDRICLKGDNQKQADLLAGAPGSSDQA